MDADQSKIIVEYSQTTFSRITNGAEYREQLHNQLGLGQNLIPELHDENVLDLNPVVEEIVEENEGFNLIEEDTQNDSRKIWLDASIKLLLSVYGDIFPKV